MCFGAIAAGLPRLKANFTHTAFFKGNDPALLRFEAFERRFGNDDAVVVVVHSPSGIFDVESATLLRELTDAHVAGARGDPRRLARQLPVGARQGRRDRGRAAAARPGAADAADPVGSAGRSRSRTRPSPTTWSAATATRRWCTRASSRRSTSWPIPPAITAETRKLAAEFRRGDHEIHLTGSPIVTSAFQETSSHDSSILVPLLLLMVLLFLVASFRRFGGVVMPLTVIIVSVVASLAVGGWLGLELSVVTMTLPQVMIAVCVSDAVHLLAVFYQARQRGLARREAAYFSLSKNFIATILTSITTAAGFYSFATAKLPPILALGVMAGTGTVLAWFVTYLILGPLMVKWPGREPAGAANDITGEHETLKAATARTTGYIAAIKRWRWAIIGGTLAIFVGGTALTLRNTRELGPVQVLPPRATRCASRRTS